MKKIITDCDGVLLDWSFAFDVWMREYGYIKLPNTENYFKQSERYGIPEEEALVKVYEFNHTGALGFLPAYKDSVEYITKLATEGWKFDVVSMIGRDKYAQRLREKNLKHLFGEVFDEIYCAGDFRKPKKNILEKYKGTGYYWIEDRVEYANDGKEVGLNTIIMDWPYNRFEWKGKRAKNWKEIYKIVNSEKT